MIDLSQVRAVLRDCQGLIEHLDGLAHDDSALFTENMSGAQKRQVAKQAAKQAQVERSKALLLLGDRLQLAAALVNNEYWFARGELDPLNPEREDDDDGGAEPATEG